MYRKIVFTALPVYALLSLLLLSACSDGNDSSSDSSGPSSAATASSSPAPSPSAATTPSAPKVAEPVFDKEMLKNTTGKTLIKSFTSDKSGAYHASYAIVSKSGTVAIADPYKIWNKEKMPYADIITVSHGHPDHDDAGFRINSKHAKVSNQTEESFTVKDITVTAIPANHAGEYASDMTPSDYIYVFEVDGLRIAHFGDFGQSELVQDQLDKLGRIDVVLTRYSNMSQYGASPDTTVRILEQLKPKITSPTHYEPETIQAIVSKLKLDDRGETAELAIDRADLDAIDGTAYYMIK